MSNDGTLLVTISHDQSMKVFDVVNFDMMHMVQLPFVPAVAEWVYRVSCRPVPKPAPTIAELPSQLTSRWNTYIHLPRLSSLSSTGASPRALTVSVTQVPHSNSCNSCFAVKSGPCCMVHVTIYCVAPAQHIV